MTARTLLLLPLFFPLAAASQATETAKNFPRRFTGYSFGLNGLYGYPEMYGYGFSAGLDFRKVTYSVSGSSNSFVPGYRGYRMGTVSFATMRLPGTEFPWSYTYGAINRLSERAETRIEWKPGKGKLRVKLHGIYTNREDSMQFMADREMFTGTGFRSFLSTHEGSSRSEGLSGELNVKYSGKSGSSSNPLIEFTSSYYGKRVDVSTENRYISLQDAFPWGFSAFSTNREQETSSEWSNSLTISRLWFPWLKHEKYEGFKYNSKKRVKLHLSHTMSLKDQDAIFSRRMDLLPDSGSAVNGIQQFYGMNSRRSGQRMMGVLTLYTIARIKKPDIDFTFWTSGSYSEHFYNRKATRTDIFGVAPEPALATDAVIRQKISTQTLGINLKWFQVALAGQYMEVDVRNSDGAPGTKRSIYRVLPSVKGYFLKKVEFSYETELLPPSATELLPNPDWQNPTYIVAGNPALDFGVARELSTDWGRRWLKASRKDTTQQFLRQFNLGVDVTWVKNNVVLSARIDSAGICYLAPENVPNTFKVYGWTGFRRDLSPRMELDFRGHHHWQIYDYRRNDVLYTMSANEAEGSLSIRYKGKWLQTGVMTTYDHVTMDFTREKNFVRTIQSIVLSGSVMVTFSEKHTAHIQLDQVTFYGPEGAPPRSIPVLTASARWKGPDKFPVSISVEANDLLNRNQYFTRTGGIGTLQKTSGWAPGRYVTVSASWGMSKSLKK